MISLANSWAVVIRHTRLWAKDPNILLCYLYWPLLDILTWGFLGSWMQQLNPQGSSNYSLIAISGLVLFQICSRGCNTMCFAFNEELWTGNLTNLFSLPLHLGEWMLGALLLTSITILLTSTVCLGTAFALYNIPICKTLVTYFIFAPPLLLSCIWLGFTSLAMIALLGRRGTELGFIFSWFFLPFSGAYYPIEILPAWGQTIASWLPMAPVFSGMRAYLGSQQDPTPFLIKGYAMGTVYAAIGIALFAYSFNRSKEKGLSRLLD